MWVDDVPIVDRGGNAVGAGRRRRTVTMPAASGPKSGGSAPGRAVVALHEVGERGTCLRPVRLVAEDDAVATPFRELAHRGQHGIVALPSRAPPVDRAEDEVLAKEVERDLPAADAHEIPFAEPLEHVVVPDRVLFVVAHVRVEVQTTVPAKPGEATVVIRGLVADRTDRRVVLPRWLAVRQAATTAERARTARARDAALEAHPCALRRSRCRDLHRG